MKRLAFVIGFVLLLAPNVTHAQSAVSPYMQRVITRAEAGIAFAKESGSLEAAVTFFLPSFRPFMEMAGSTVLGLIDTQQRIFSPAKPQCQRANQLILSRTARPKKQHCACRFCGKLSTTPGT